MKRKFNIYCTIFLCVLLLGAGSSFIKGSMGFWAGANEAIKFEGQGTPLVVSLNPQQGLTNYTDSITNTLTGEPMKMSLCNIIVGVNQIQDYQSMAWWNVGITVAFILYFVVIVYFWINFLRIIICVNKGLIFDRIIEHRLMKGGWTLLVAYALEWGIAFMFYLYHHSMIQLDGYEIDIPNTPDNIMLYVAIGLMLIAQIFSLGRQMKEEQELTI